MRVDQPDDRVKYDIIGRYELLDAYGNRCGYCGEQLDIADQLVTAHVTSVLDRGQHTRANIAPVHQKCELAWNAIERLKKR